MTISIDISEHCQYNTSNYYKLVHVILQLGLLFFECFLRRSFPITIWDTTMYTEVNLQHVCHYSEYTKCEQVKKVKQLSPHEVRILTLRANTPQL